MQWKEGQLEIKFKGMARAGRGQDGLEGRVGDDLEGRTGREKISTWWMDW